MVTQLDQSVVQVGDIEAHVMRKGQGDPLVYLHGAFGYQGWPAFLDHLTEQFTVYAPVHPGFGETDGIEHIDTLLDLTLYHFDLFDALGLELPYVVGHYIGGMIAAEMAALCPHSVNKLVLAAPAGFWLDDNPGVDYFATPRAELNSLLFTNPESDIARATMPEPQSDEERGQQHIERMRSLATVGKFLWPIPDKGLKKRLGRIKAPTLVAVGENDPIVPQAYGDEFARRIPGALSQIFEGGGHLFMLEQPDEFAEAVVDFLAS